MQISKAQIAALVLGYLKSEKLFSVVDEFVKYCSYFGENNENVKIGKYFVTRVGGMSLIDFLEEYSMIYSIVQGRLEETKYYETHNSRTTLIEQLLYLLDKELSNVASSTPIMSENSEVDATPAHTLPGNIDLETDITKTPKKRSSRNKSGEKEELIDMTQVLTQSLLENHELHEKIAETINFVRNTPEVTTVLEEHISAGASKELDAVIKTVIQRTEEDPLYNKLIDEIIGTTSTESTPGSNKKSSCNIPFHDPMDLDIEDIHKSSETTIINHAVDVIDDHNNDAIRSIIEVSQNPDPPPPKSPRNDAGGGVYVFDGSLDTYLQSSGAATNPLYINPGLIVVPTPETSKQFYLVNNQPLLKMTVPTVLTEKELMSIPTIIVNDEKTSQPLITENKTTKKSKGLKVLKPKPTEIPVPAERTQATKKKKRMEEQSLGVTPTISEACSETRQASHVRNLDFSSPKLETAKAAPKKRDKTWDADLRQLIRGFKDKSPSPKKKRPLPNNTKKSKNDDKVEIVEEEREEGERGDDREVVAMQTPVKQSAPKTPEGAQSAPPGDYHCTPFTDVLEEQLKGVDLNSIPTPSIPITPGFNLTPGDMIPYNQRPTDYSTSSSYYQPSDTEQSATIHQLLEECRRLDTNTSTQDKSSSLKILSDVVIEQAKVTLPKNETKKTKNDHLNKFNNNVIGKKNLSLINRQPTTSSSSSDSDFECEKSQSRVDETQKNASTMKNKDTVQAKKNSNNMVKNIDTNEVKKDDASTIKDILDTVQVKNTLEEEKRKNFLSRLEEVRKRTITKIKNEPQVKKQARNSRKISQKAPKASKKKCTRKRSVDENGDEMNQKLKDLAQRGIHLIPKKAQQKPEEQENEEEKFEANMYAECEVVKYEGKSEKRKKPKSYDLDVLKKSMSVQVYIEDIEMTRIMKWTECECVLDSERLKQPKGVERTPLKVDDDLMDYAIVASSLEDSSDVRGCKGGKKRKSKFGEDDNKTEKRNKAFENIQLLKEIDVDDFLNKVHGE